MPRVEYEKLSDQRFGEPSECVRQRVEAARDRQRQRGSKAQRTYRKALLPPKTAWKVGCT